MKWKIIQIAAPHATDLIALCDDWTVWRRKGTDWVRIEVMDDTEYKVDNRTMNECIVCWKDISNINQKLRCLKCYCNSDNDKYIKDYIINQ